MKLSAITLSLMMLCFLRAAEATPTPAPISQYEGDRNLVAALRSVWPILESSGKALRVYYRANCQADVEYPIPFPRLVTQKRDENVKGISAIQELFRGDEAVTVTVTERKRWVVNIVIGKVPDDILRTKISDLTLKPRDQYDADQAIRVIEASPEFQRAIHTLGLQRVSKISNQLIQMPAPGLPHLQSSMKNISVDQALDAVARTFGVAVIYGYCAAPPQFDITVIGRD